MKALLSFALALTAFSANASARAENLTEATIPIFSQKIGFKFETGWHPGDQQANANVFLLELVPGSENINTWTKMLTVEGYRDLGTKTGIEEAFKTETDSVMRACPGNSVNKRIAAQNAQGYESIVAIVGCLKHPEIKDRNEVALYNFIKGRSDIYMTKKSFRESLTDKDAIHLSEANYKDIAGEVLDVKICKNNGQGPDCILDPK